jgi:hypothetical protein
MRIDMTIEQFKVMVVLWKEKSSKMPNLESMAKRFRLPIFLQ